MKWEEFVFDAELEDPTQIQTSIECPECGKRLYFNSTITLTCYPPQYLYWCSCGWKGTARKKWNSNG